MARSSIVVRGAREHNLNNINVEIPRDQFVVITGLSGSGKSSLAFDTIYAEGQRRYVESLSAYARQFLGQMEKPDVDSIDGLSPAISIEQRSSSRNPRSTVGTVTEIYDYMRLLFARVGKPYCYSCGRAIARQTVSEIVDRVLELGSGTRVQILAPMIRGKKGEYRKIFDDIARQGFIRVRVDGSVYDINEDISLEKNKKHNIELVVDRLTIKTEAGRRLTDSIETALKVGEGTVIIHEPEGRQDSRKTKGKAGKAKAMGPAADGVEHVFSEHFACTHCGISFEELTPRMFSFNSPFGACPECDGLGTRLEIDPELVVPDTLLSLNEGAIAPHARSTNGNDNTPRMYPQFLKTLSRDLKFSLDTPFKKLKKSVRDVLLYGSGKREFNFNFRSSRMSHSYTSTFEGVIPRLERRYKETASSYIREEIEKYMDIRHCHACDGERLRPEARAVKVGGEVIARITGMTIKAAEKFFSELTFSDREMIIAKEILKEIRNRLGFLKNVGLDYLTLNRRAGTLSGGEAQRIHLATQVGSKLMGVLYILDEPSIGLHQRDNRRLLATLHNLRDLGNTVLVVEHDEETILESDYVIDLGPGAGIHGGRIVAQGTPKEIMKSRRSLTGKYLNRELVIPVPKIRREPNGKYLKIIGAAQNNLRNINVTFPLGLFTCVTGVSGSGKSSLVNEVLYKTLSQKLHHSHGKPGVHKEIDGLEYIDKVISVDQSPIGRTPRSNPATYTGLFTPIRDLFAQTPEARARGYKAGRFSFNVRGGRCEACEGDGIIRIEMHFLPDVYVPCEVCKGKRYNRETLEITYKGKTIADVLEMIVEEALEFFANIPAVRRRLQTLHDVGLDYIHLGQSATTLSGGEAQRIKLSTELGKRATGRTVYILDEPTTGLHFADVSRLLDVLHRLVDSGNSVIVIEHNLDVIKTADHIIDLGPEGGDEGGAVVAAGTPEEVVKVKGSYTGKYLKGALKSTMPKKKIKRKTKTRTA